MHHRRQGRGRRRTERRLRFLQRRLDLGEDQLDQLRERLGRHRAEGRELYRAHRAERLDIIRSVLDDEQRARFDAAIERRRARHGGHGRHGRRHEGDVRA